MRPVFLINGSVLFEPDRRRLCPLAAYPEHAVLLHGPVSECLLQLLEHNGEVLTQRFLFAAVWEKQGAIVTTNALYQTIASIRKALKAAGMAENVVLTVPKEGFKSVARIQAGTLETFITTAVEPPVDALPEEPEIASPTRHSQTFRGYFSTKAAYAVAGLLFIVSCTVLYLQINVRHTLFADYQHIGNTAGCDVYASWHDKIKSQDIFTGLIKRYPIQCSTGGVAYMTLNRFQDGISVIICDKPPDINGAQCDRSCTGNAIMRINKRMTRWMAILLAIILPLFYAGYLHYQRNNFSCESHLTIVDDDSVVDSIMTFTFRNGSGTYYSTGEYRQAGQQSITISNKVAFNYWREDGHVIMVSSDTNELPKKDEPFRRYIPDFFHHHDNGISVEIIPANASSYLFVFSTSPAFYCSKS